MSSVLLEAIQYAHRPAPQGRPRQFWSGVGLRLVKGRSGPPLRSVSSLSLRLCLDEPGSHGLRLVPFRQLMLGLQSERRNGSGTLDPPPAPTSEACWDSSWGGSGDAAFRCAARAGSLFSGPTPAQQLGIRPSRWVPVRPTRLFAPRREQPNWDVPRRIGPRRDSTDLSRNAQVVGSSPTSGSSIRLQYLQLPPPQGCHQPDERPTDRGLSRRTCPSVRNQNAITLNLAAPRAP